jgi:hypothetical protein
MDRNEYRDEDESQPDAYWRRRVITLALGLGLLGLLAWGFSGGGAKNQPNPGVLPASALGTAVPGVPNASPAGPAKPAPGSSAGTGSAGTGSAGTGGAGTGGAGSPAAGASAAGNSGRGKPGSGTVGGGPGTGSPSGGHDAQSARPLAGTKSGANPPVTGSGGQCPPGSVVLSVFSDRSSYGPGEEPWFEVYAVSTTPGSCVFEPGQLHLDVLSQGRIIWDSADCARGGDGRAVQLTRGVPAQDGVVWNRSITLPGCQVLASSARSGTYQVEARTATVTSPVRDFRLTGP